MVSLVDFLNARGVDSSFDSRTKLWQQFRPNEKYEGTATQNTASNSHFEKRRRQNYLLSLLENKLNNYHC